MKIPKRQALAFFLFAGLLAASLSAASCKGMPAATEVPSYAAYTYQFLGAFDTTISLIGHMTSQKQFDDFSAYAENRFQELNRLFDIYHDYPGVVNLKTVNDQAGIAPVTVPQEIMDLLALAEEWVPKTDGKVSVTFGSVLAVWRAAREQASAAGDGQGKVPDLAQLEEANRHVAIGSLILDKSNHTAYLNDPDARIDVGAVAKGFAVELVAKELSALGYTSFAISAGGNVKVVGEPLATGRDAWVIGIRNPVADEDLKESDEIIAKAAVTNTSVVTSGWYQRYFIAEGVIYHHIIDPDTLFPSNYSKSVTIVYPDSGVADILSTAAMLMPYEKAAAWIETIPGASAYFVLMDGEIKTAGAMEVLLIPDDAASSEVISSPPESSLSS